MAAKLIIFTLKTAFEREKKNLNVILSRFCLQVKIKITNFAET